MAQGDLPLFYRQPRALNPEHHGKHALLKPGHYGFSSQANAVPLLAAEMVNISRYLPIVFSEGETANLAALLGLRPGQNLCVAADGLWQAGEYVPAYLRRYPFILDQDLQRQTLTLCIDEAATTASTGTHGLFDVDGQPSELTRQALAFCRDFHAHHLLTQEFCQAIQAEGLLVSRVAEIELPNASRQSLNGFRVIDAHRFNQLSGKVLLQWRAKGWLPLVYAHLQSIDNWSLLLKLAT